MVVTPCILHNIACRNKNRALSTSVSNLRELRDIRGQVCSTFLASFFSRFRLFLLLQQNTAIPIIGKAKRRNNKNNNLFSPVAFSGTSFFTFSCAGSSVTVTAFEEGLLLEVFVVWSWTGVGAVKIDRWTWSVNLSSPGSFKTKLIAFTW